MDTAQMDYQKLIEKYPWIIEPNANTIISPDSDGFLCGLLMSHYLNWKIRGFYDGKVLLLKKGVRAKDCIFLDMDIYRQDVRSTGHHMLMFNKKRIPENWRQFDNCIQPNNYRNYDFYNDFQLKYPLANVHFLIGILGVRHQIKITKSAICPLLFTDGTWMNLFQYTENCLSWIRYLGAENRDSPLHQVFCNEHYSVYAMMIAINDFLRKRDSICASRELGGRERGDRLVISNTEGSCNIHQEHGAYAVDEAPRKRALEFMALLSELTSWEYKADHWDWADYQLLQFTKEIFFKQGRVSNRDFEEFIRKNPLSYALTSNQRIEYTLETPDHL